MNSSYVDLIVETALNEDLNEKMNLEVHRKQRLDFVDVTSGAIFKEEKGEASVFAKSAGILSGTLPFRKVFRFVDPTISVNFLRKDGESFHTSEKIVSIMGNIKSILKGERTALNFLSHLSGIATEVYKLVRMLKETEIKILDTRKTLPGMRALEKQAVVHGGGKNHRMGLFDMVLIKDNHIDAAGSITDAVNRVHLLWGEKYKIEVETRTLEEVSEALLCGVDRIMLDNMPKSQIKKAAHLIMGKSEIEVSGNMSKKKIRKLRKTPIDFISAGYITYAPGHCDFSLKILKK